MDRDKEEFLKELLEENRALKKENEILTKQLFTDELTGLDNRKALVEKLFKSNIGKHTVVIMDIEAFRNINEIYGVEAGNFVLKAFSKLLLMYIGEDPTKRIFRTNSDEFIFLIEDPLEFEACEKEIKNFSNYIREKCDFYYEKLDTFIGIEVTLGVAVDDDRSLEKADIALKSAKKSKLPYSLYLDDFWTSEDESNDLKWSKLVKKAIKEDDVLVYCQPIFNVFGDIDKYECLVRINDNGNIIPPFRFLDISKKINMYNHLTQRIVDKSLSLAKEKNVNLSINLSAQDMVNDDITNYIIEKLQELNIGNNITFEILESESIENFEKILAFIHAVKKLGVKIAIDDFGTGYSNFSYILKLEPDIIKIDGSLIKDLDKNPNAEIVTRTIVEFSKKLGIKTIGEFVHSKEILERSKKLEIDYFQGFFLSEPKSII